MSFGAKQVLLLIALVQLLISIEIEEVKPRWIYNDNTRSLPDSIEIDFELESGKITLHLLKQSLESTRPPLIINELKGQRLTWKQSKDELLAIYKDSSFDATATVAIEEVDGFNKTKYIITFSHEEKSISLFPKATFEDATSLYKTDEVAIGKDNKNTNNNNKSKLINIDGTVHSLIATPITNSEMNILVDQDNLGGMARKTKIMKRSDQQPTKKRLMTVEIFTVIDDTIFKKFFEESKGTTDIEKRENAKKNILFIFTHIMEGVKDVYENIESQKFKFTTKWLGALIAEDSKDAPFIRDSMNNKGVVDGEKVLRNMKYWASKKKTENDDKAKLPRFDFLATFTRFQVQDKGMPAMGITTLDEICNFRNNGIFIFLNIFNTIKVLSHELGHSLNASHDGSMNECNSRDNFIMTRSDAANTRNNSHNNYVFSQCSVSSFEKKINVLDRKYGNCLANGGKDFNQGRERDIFLQLLPGQIYDLDDQCKLTYGPESFETGGHNKDQDICRVFKCNKGLIKWAMDGTSCSNGAWCLKGKCTPDSRAPRAPERCINGDYNEPHLFPKCKDPINQGKEMCMREDINDACCASCAGNTTRSGVCQDTVDECPSLEPKDCYYQYYATACCNTCRALVQNPSDADCLYGDKGFNCSNLVPEVCHLSTRYCCQTCSDYLSSTKTGFNSSASPVIANVSSIMLLPSTISTTKTASSSPQTTVFSINSTRITSALTDPTTSSITETGTESDFTTSVPPESTSTSSKRTRFRCSNKGKNSVVN